MSHVKKVERERKRERERKVCLSKACKKEVLNWTDGTWYCCGLFVRVSFLYLLACLVCIHLHVYLSVSIYPKLSSEKVLKRRSIWVKVKKVILVGNMSRDKFEMDRTHTVNTHTHTKHTHTHRHTHILSLSHTQNTHIIYKMLTYKTFQRNVLFLTRDNQNVGLFFL